MAIGVSTRQRGNRYRPIPLHTVQAKVGLSGDKSDVNVGVAYYIYLQSQKYVEVKLFYENISLLADHFLQPLAVLYAEFMVGIICRT